MKKLLALIVFIVAVKVTAFAQPTISLPTISPCTTDDPSFCMDVTVKDFTDILSMEFSIAWDPSVIRFDEVRNFSLPGLSVADFDVTDAANGIITLKWRFNDCGPGVTGVTLDDDQRIFSLCFTALGAYGATTAVEITNMPVDIKVTRVNACPNNIGLFRENGLVSTCVRPLELVASEEEGNEGDLICVDFAVNGFDNLTSMQFSVNWDSDILQFEDVIVLDNLVNLSESGFGKPGDSAEVPPGALTVSWNFVDPSSNTGISLEDGTNIFQICFRVIGPCESGSDITFTSSPTLIEVTNTVEEGFELTVTSDPGSIQVGDCDPTGLQLIADCGPPVDINDEVCVRVTTANFNDIEELDYLMQWNPNILEFKEVKNPNGGVVGFGTNDFLEDNVQNGVLGVQWETVSPGLGQSLPDGALLYEVCFTVKGLGGDSPFRFPATPALVKTGSSPNIGIAPSNCEVQVNQPEGVTLVFDNGEGSPGDTVCVDVSASNFQDIQSMQYSLAWDTAHVTFLEVQNLTLPEAGLDDFGLSGINGGSLTFNWQPSQSYTLDEGERIMTLCYVVTGTPKECQFVEIIDLPLESEAISASSNGNNVGLAGQGGEICVLNPDGYSLIIGQEEGFLGDTVCIPFTVADFQGITSTGFTATWNPAALNYLELNTTGALPLDPNLNFGTGSVDVGLLSFNFEDAAGVDLADSTVIFEICYLLLGPKNECHEITLTNDQAVNTLDGEGSIQLEPGAVCIKDQFIIENVAIKPVSCPGGKDGEIELTVSGGTGTIFYNWGSDPIQFTNRARNLPVGQVTVTIFDSNNPPLIQRDTFQIPLTDNLPVADAGMDMEAPCREDGQPLDIFLLDGKGSEGPEYSYRWSTEGGTLPGDRDALISVGQGPGLYILTVRNDETFCSTSDTIQVSEPTVPVSDAGQDFSFDCSMDTLQLNGSGSTMADSVAYAWTALDGGEIVPGEDSLISPSITAPGTFVLNTFFTDTGCGARDTVLVEDLRVFPDAEAGADTELSCTEDFVLLDGSGSVNDDPVDYSWLNAGGEVLSSSITYQASEFGTYFLQVTNPVTGCTSTDSVRVVASDEFPVVDAGESQTLTCFNDTLTLVAEVNNAPDFDFQWVTTQGGEIVPGEENSLTPRVAQPGVYELVVTNNANGCVASDSLVISENRNFPLAEAGDGTTLTCNDNTFILDGTGSTPAGDSIAYTWTLDGQTVALDTLQVEITTPGTYLLEVTNRINGCSTTDSVQIIDDTQPPQITMEPAPTLNCTESIAVISATLEPANANYAFQWEAVDGGNIVSGAGSLAAEVDQPGIYRLTATNQETGCVSTEEVVVLTDVEFPVADAGADQTITCQDSVAMLDGSGSSMGTPFSYEWLAIDGAGAPNPADTLQTMVETPGLYELVVTNNDNNCVSRDTVQVNENTALPEISIADPGQLSCTDNTLTLDGSASEFGPQYSVEWTGTAGQPIENTNDPLQVNISEPGTYQLLLRNNETGCENTATVEVQADDSLPTADAGGDQVLPCPGQPITLDGSNSSTGADITYQWTVVEGQGTISNPNSLQASVTQAGTYQLEVTNTSNGCSATATVVATEDPDLVPANAGEDMSVCETTGMLFAELPAAATGTWSTTSGAKIESPNQASTFVEELSNGDNVFTWTVSLPTCPEYSSDEVIIRKEIAPVANNDLATVPADSREQDINVVANDQLNTNGPWEVTVRTEPSLGRIEGVNGGTVTYIPNPGIFGEDQFSYEICNLSCPGLCDTAFVQVTLEFDEDFQPELPNAITPNGDGINDELVFDVLENAIDFWPDNELVVFNRWGDIVYRAEPYANNWRGTTDSGMKLPDGTYYYVLRLDISNGIIYKGDITILDGPDE